MSDSDTLHSSIWDEEPSASNPFVAQNCYCYGYDVFGDLLGKVSWIEYIFLLFTGEKPKQQHTEMLSLLAVALANPGPRDASIHAAMCAGVGGSSSASCLMAALGVGAGNLNGGHEVYEALKIWHECSVDLDCWKKRIQHPIRDDRADVWETMEHFPGFDPYGTECPLPVIQLLDKLVLCDADSTLAWLKDNRLQLEKYTQCPLSTAGVASALFYYLGLSAEQSEMIYLIFRLPGAAVHALEQRNNSWRKFPFFGNKLHLTNDPGSA